MTAALTSNLLRWGTPGLASCFEILMAELLIVCHQPRRDHSWARMAVWIMSVALLTLGIALLMGAPGGLAQEQAVPALGLNLGSRMALAQFVFYSAYLVSTIPLLLSCYKVSPQVAVFCSTAGYAMQNVASGLGEAFGLALAHGVGPLSPTSSALVTLLLCAALYATLYHLVLRNVTRQDLSVMDDKGILAMVGIVIFAIIGFDLLLKTNVLRALSLAAALCLRAFHALVCLFVFFVEVELVANRQLRGEIETTERLLAERERQYKLSRENMEAINLKCHDLRHQIRHLSDGGTGAVDRATLADIARDVAVYDSGVLTGNEALDTILTEKSLVCESRGITLTCMADGHLLDLMAPADIYSLFGNALDNAIEAVSATTAEGRRSISLVVRERAGMASIHIENLYDAADALSFVDGLPQTTKPDKANHGFGTRSMQAIVQRYGGILTLSANEDTFSLDALLPHSSDAP